MDHSIELLGDDDSITIDKVRSKVKVQSIHEDDKDLEVLEVRRNEIIDLSMEGPSSDISSVRWNIKVADNLASSPGRLVALETQIEAVDKGDGTNSGVSAGYGRPMVDTCPYPVDSSDTEPIGNNGSRQLKSGLKDNILQETRVLRGRSVPDALLSETDNDSAITLPTSEDIRGVFTASSTVSNYGQIKVPKESRRMATPKFNGRWPSTVNTIDEEVRYTVGSSPSAMKRTNQEDEVVPLPTHTHPEVVTTRKEEEMIVGSQNVLRDFPISSPVPQSQKPDEVPSEIDLNFNLGIDQHVQAIKDTERVTPVPPISKAKRRPGNKVTKPRIQRRTNKKGKDLMDGIELNLTELLEESINEGNGNEDEDVGDIESDSSITNQTIGGSQPVPKFSSRLESRIVLPIHRSRTVGNNVNDITEQSRLNDDEADDNTDNESTVKRLSHFIVNSQIFSEAESKALISRWHKENKQAFRKANQIYRDNETARSPIIVEITKPLLQTFQSTELNVKELISPATLQESYRTDVPLIRFFRRCSSVYDLNCDCYYPCDTRIVEETVSLLYYNAQRFFELYAKDKRTLYKVLRAMSRDGKDIILVLSDLDGFKRVIRKREDLKFKAKVREELTGSPSGNLNTDNNKATGNTGPRQLDPPKNILHNFEGLSIEQRLRYIDKHWKVKIFTVNSDLEFLNSLPNLVSLIGKKRMDPALRFARFSHINVRVGKDKTDVFRKALQEVARIPELKTRAITRLYSSFQGLFHDLNEGRLEAGLDGRHLMSENMEKKIYNLFMCSDPNKVIT